MKDSCGNALASGTLFAFGEPSSEFGRHEETDGRAEIGGCCLLFVTRSDWQGRSVSQLIGGGGPQYTGNSMISFVVLSQESELDAGELQRQIMTSRATLHTGIKRVPDDPALSYPLPRAVPCTHRTSVLSRVSQGVAVSAGMATVWKQDPLWTQQIGGLTRILGRAPAHLTLRSKPFPNKEASRRSSFSGNPALPRECLAGEGSSSEGRRQEQELLWRQFFLDPTLWWDNRQHKKSSRSPDFRRKWSGYVLWLDNLYRPPWVDEHLAALDMQMGCCVPTSKSSLSDMAEPGRRAEYEIGVKAVTVPTLWQHGTLTEAVEALEVLAQTGCAISKSLFYTVLKQCVAKKDLVLGRRVHALTVKNGYESDTFLCYDILRMYLSHARLQEAMAVFNVFAKVAAPDCYMWASMILAHARHGQSSQAILLYRQMRGSTIQPNNYVYVAVLKACTSAADLAAGKEIHADIIESEGEPNLFVCTCLVDMYAKCGKLEDARRLFDQLPKRDVVIWNVLISGYAQQGYAHEALGLFRSMHEEGLTSANHVTFACLLQACASVGALHQGKQLHAQIQERGLEKNVVVGNSLVDMYAKCGMLEHARTVFDRLPTRNVVTWNVLITGYAQHGRGQEALAIFAKMEANDITPADHVTYVGLLQACASVGALHQGKKLHAQIQQRGLGADVAIGNCLVNMYSKCGSLEDARRVFDKLPMRNVVTWTALLNGYAEHSDGVMAIQCFKDMLHEGVEPDDTSFRCLLVACSHAGLVHEGQQYFKMMVEEHGIVPSDHHYNCMVDLLGRSGHLDEAENMLQTMPLENYTVGWTSLLTACKSHGDVERGRRCFNHLRKLEPQNSAAYVLVSTIYANAGRWKDVQIIEGLRKSAGAKKKPAKACIEVNNKVHEFTVGEERADISSRSQSMNLQLKEEGGHVPHTELVLKAVSQQEKEAALCGHAEKLALAYGLLNTPRGTTLLVTKNLRMCNDCHSSTKIVSQLEKREIIVRDAHRVHRFQNGSCSCGDRH